MPVKTRLLLGGTAACLAIYIYDTTVRALLGRVVPLPPLAGGVTGLTLLLWLSSLLHATYALGWRHSLTFFGLSAGISWIYEEVGVATGLIFGAYHYTEALGARLGQVPVLIPIAWFMMIYPSYVVANLVADGQPVASRGGPGRVVWLAFLGAMTMTAWDLLIDPILSNPRAPAWVWEEGGPYFGVPLHNYAGWILTTFTVYLIYRSFEHAFRPQPVGPTTRRAAVLPLVAYGAMLSGNLLSTSLEALWVIGPFAMGLPLLIAASRLWK